MVLQNNECSFAHGLLLTHNLAKKSVATRKSLHSFSVFVKCCC